MKILHCLKLSLNAFLEMLEKTFCYYDFKKEKETKDDFFKVNPAKTDFKFNPKPSYCVAYVTSSAVLKTKFYVRN